MNIYRIIHIVLLCCLINEGFAWFFGRRSSSSSSRDTSRKSSSSISNSGSKTSSSGWWSRNPNQTHRHQNKNLNPQILEKKKSSGWLWGKNRNAQKTNPKPNTPMPKPKPKPTAKPIPLPSKPKSDPSKAKTNTQQKTDSGREKSSGWFWGTNKNVQKSKPKPNTPMPNTPKPKPTAKPIPLPSKPKSDPSKANTITQQKTDMRKVIEEYEKMKLEAYDAQPKNPEYHDTTVGIGFNMKRPESKKTFEKVLPGVDFDKVKSGKQSITENQARALFEHDIDNIYEPRARNKIGKDVYDNLPPNVKTAVVNAVYRGDLGPKTAKLMREGKWAEVGKEYLDHNQYKNADKLGIPGVKTRMDWNKDQFDTMIKPKS